MVVVQVVVVVGEVVAVADQLSHCRAQIYAVAIVKLKPR